MESTVRTRHGLVEAQTIVLRHPITGHIVELVGVLHVADAAFWRYLNKHMRSRVREGYVVHYELVSGSYDQITNDRAGKMMRRFSKAAKLVIEKAKAAGLTYQLDGIRYPTGAVNTDMTKQQMRHAFADAPWSMPAKLWLAAHVLQAIPTSMFKETLATTIANSKSTMSAGGLNDKVIVDARNTIATRAALSAQYHVVAVWGAAHLPGISANLKEAGYRVINKRWLPVYAYHSCPQQ
jgi:hypothetical protein